LALSFRHLRPLLNTHTSTLSRWLSFIGLAIGVLLLLSAIQLYFDIQTMLKEKSVRKNGYDFIAITKTITNETMGQEEKNLFHQPDINELKSKAFVDDVAPLAANQFRVQLSAGEIIPFQTDLFLETIDNSFIDTIPPSFQWQVGQMNIPIIISSDFLEIYNVFAPGQGLPHVSEETASGIPMIITCYGNGQQQQFRGNIVAFSDRINSVLVPKTFLDWANQTFGEQKTKDASRLFLKTKDANNPELLNFLDQKNYKINKDKTKFGRVKQILQGILTGLGVFGLLVVVLALMLFSFYLQLIIARSKENLQLLLTLGYSPAWLSKKVAGRFVPVYITVIVAALLLTQLLHWLFYQFVVVNKADLSLPIHWLVLLIATLLIVLSVFSNYRLVKRLLYKMD